MPKIAKRILSSAKKIIDDNKNSNLFLEILGNFQSKDEEVVIACCESAGKVINNFIIKTDFLELDVEKLKDKDLSKDEQFHSWLQEHYQSSCDMLFDHLNSHSFSIKTSSFEALITILSSLDQKNTTNCVSRMNEIVQKVITLLLDSDTDREKVISLLPALLAGCENNNKEITVKLLTNLRQQIKEIERTKKMTDMKSFNIWHIIVTVCGMDELDGKAKVLINKIVLGFLKQEVPIKLYKEILTGISTVMEQMTSPLLLADFLSESFNIGGAISLMSLNGLFTLMHKYNLNYPDFYEKLYSMLQPQIFGAKYRSRFFHLTDLFLSSTHLPSYLIAAFTKRLARLCLHAPASGVQIAVPFIFNLIHRHPACDILLHRPEGNKEFESDPYIEGETLVNCHALDSCLWELKTLEHHFDPSISSKSKKRKITEEDISTYLDRTISEIMDMEAKKKKDVALTFEKQTDFELLGKFTL